MVSAETMRRWLHEIGWAWTRPKLVAKDNGGRERFVSYFR